MESPTTFPPSQRRCGPLCIDPLYTDHRGVSNPPLAEGIPVLGKKYRHQTSPVAEQNSVFDFEVMALRNMFSFSFFDNGKKRVHSIPFNWWPTLFWQQKSRNMRWDRTDEVQGGFAVNDNPDE